MDEPPKQTGGLDTNFLIPVCKHKENCSPGVCSAWGRLHTSAFEVDNRGRGQTKFMERKNIPANDNEPVTKQQFLRILLEKGVIDEKDLSPQMYSSLKKVTTPKKRNNKLYDTELLLRHYRGVNYSIHVDLLEMASGIDTPEAKKHKETLEVLKDHLGTAIQHEFDAYTHSRKQQRAKSVALCIQYLHIVDKALEVLYKSPHRGMLYSRILYYAYVSEDVRCSQDGKYGFEAVRQSLIDEGFTMSHTQYYRNRNTAIECVSPILWGALSKDMVIAIMSYGANYV